MGRGVLGLLASLATLGVVAINCTTTSAASAVSMQALMNKDGSGHLFVNDQGGPRLWEACSPDLQRCSPFGRGREIDTYGADPNTVFRVKGDGIGISPEWRGRLKQVSPPTISGVIRANEFVSPLPGGWSGGWKDEVSELQLSACQTPQGTKCTTLTDIHYVRQCAVGASFALESQFAGSYLRVADRRVGTGPSFYLAYRDTSPYGQKVWRPSRNTSVAVVGQIAQPVGPYAGNCGPPSPNSATISGRGIASITCAGGCRAVLIASRAGRKARIVRNVPGENPLMVAPPDRLRVSRPDLERIGIGRVRFLVKINGDRAAQRLVSLPVSGNGEDFAVPRRRLGSLR